MTLPLVVKLIILQSLLPPETSKTKTSHLPRKQEKEKNHSRKKALHQMNLLLFAFFIQLSIHSAISVSEIQFGSQYMLAVPTTYIKGFIGRAFLMETNQPAPNFRTALTVEAVDEEKYACSLDVFLGDFRVWSSGHFSRFYTMEKCMLYLTHHGDLQLRGQNDLVGWRTGTSRQGVEKLSLMNNGNLVLADELNVIAWQSFNFPTNVMLWGQRLDVETRLTSFPSNSSSFYSFEIQRDKIALYLNTGKWKHSYWKFKPSNNRNISFIRLGSKRLEILNDFNQKIAQIQSERVEPLRFLAIGNKTGNLGFYYFSPDTGKFEVSFQALNSTCDLPLACKPYGICTFTNVCSCIRLVTQGDRFNSDCSKDATVDFCGEVQVEMLELQGVSNVLRDNPEKVNTSKEECAGFCVDDCKCVAALYTDSRECFLYGEVRGVKEVDRRSGVTYMVKVVKGNGNGSKGKHGGLKTWAVVVIGVADGLIILIVLGGVGYYVIRKRRENLSLIRNGS